MRHLLRAVHRIPWEFLPQELGSGSEMTCWRRLPDWQEAWRQPHEALGLVAVGD
jgi:hypothetical protein